MLKKLLTLTACVTALVVMTAAAWGGERGTKEEAKALVIKAQAYIKEHGKEAAFSEINNPKGVLVDRDLYIFAYDWSGTVVAHGANAKLIGKDLSEMKDPDGTYVIKGLMAEAAKGEGWFRFKWTHPQSKKVEQKEGYVVKIDNDHWMGCGFYE